MILRSQTYQKRNRIALCPVELFVHSHFLPSTGVNFINIKRTIFSYACRFVSFLYVPVTRKKAAEMTIVRKTCAFNVEEIDSRQPSLFAGLVFAVLIIRGLKNLK